MELRAEGVSRRFMRQGKGTNFFMAVKETDLRLIPGELAEITGRSGSGKSTLLNMLGGLLAPTAGRVLLDGRDLYALSDPERSRERNRHIGIIPQGQTGLHSLTVLENVLLPARMYGEKKITEEEGKALLEKVHIGHLADVYPDELSGGENRRLAVARALIMKPGILLADEPTGDLDDENTNEVLALLKQCAADGTAVLLVTHEKEAGRFADRIYEMKEGVLRPAQT